MEELTKKCTKCGEVKSLSEFSKSKNGKYGFRSVCKCCMKNYRDANKDKIKACDKYYRLANKDKIKAYYKANKARKKVYRDANKDKKKAYDKSQIKELSNYYIAKKIGMPIADCPPELIELKRAQLKLIRATKTIKP